MFKDFVFFLEIELEDGSFITIRRSVEDATKIAFKQHEAGHQDLSALALAEWGIRTFLLNARELLDGLLDWRALKPWSYRKALGYLLRSQEDFREVFQLRKFASNMLTGSHFCTSSGFDAKLIADHYAKSTNLPKNRRQRKPLK